MQMTVFFSPLSALLILFTHTFSFSFVVKLSYGCEVTFMTVCAESRASASAHPMLRVVLIEPLGDAPPTDAGAGFLATTVAI